jgi:hypothetical protein
VLGSYNKSILRLRMSTVCCSRNLGAAADPRSLQPLVWTQGPKTAGKSLRGALEQGCLRPLGVRAFPGLPRPPRRRDFLFQRPGTRLGEGLRLAPLAPRHNSRPSPAAAWPHCTRKTRGARSPISPHIVNGYCH